MLGGGLTTTVDEADLEVSATEVAFTDTVESEATGVGALYVAVVAVVFVKLPQAAPEHPVPETPQVTPLLLESFVTVAVKFTLCPWSMVVVPAGARETEIAGGGAAPPPPPPPPPQPTSATTRSRLPASCASASWGRRRVGVCTFTIALAVRAVYNRRLDYFT
jgi:hypothetical protein